MASKGYIERERNRRKDEEIKQKDRSDKMKWKTTIQNTALKGLIDSAATGIKAGIHANDATWYKKFSEQLGLYASVPLHDNVVHYSPWKSMFALVYNDVTAVVENSQTVVGVIRYLPRVGSIDGKFLINEAGASALANIGKVNSRNVPADPDVYAIYVVGTTEIAALLCWLKTNIEVAGYFNSDQYYVRNMLLLARGIPNPTQFCSELAAWRVVYNNLALRFNNEIALPGNLTFVQRRLFTASAIFKDSDLHKGQLITFNRHDNLWGTVDEDFAEVHFDTHTSYLDPYAFTQMMETMFNRIILDGDAQTLVANIRAAIPENGLLRLDPNVSDFFDRFLSPDEIKEQFHNMITLPQAFMNYVTGATLSAFCDVTSSGSGVTQLKTMQTVALTAPTAALESILAAESLFGNASNANADNQSAMIDFYKDEVSIDDMLEATRLHPVIGVSANKAISGSNKWVEQATIKVYAEGLEIPTAFETLYYDASTDTVVSKDSYTVMDIRDINAGSVVAEYLNYFNAMTKSEYFDWMFPIYAVGNSIGYTGYTSDLRALVVYPVIELGNNFPISCLTLKNLHSVCDKSLYYLSDADFARAKVSK